MGRRLLLFFSALAIATGIVVMPQRAAAQTSSAARFRRPAAALEGPPTSIGTRPLLVVVMRLPNSASEGPFVGPWDHGFAVNRYFGGGGVNGYLQAASSGAFSYTPAVGDGVVEVDYPGPADDLDTAQRAGIAALRSVDPSVDFAAFDRNGNGQVDGRELAVEVVVLGGDRLGPGETRVVAGYDPSFTQLDGVGFGRDFMVASVNGYSNFMTAVHELFHQSFDTFDAYFWGVGRLDVMGPTYGVADSARWLPSAVTRLQLGWLSPKVAEADGTYGIGDGVIVHDPSAGEARYFLVEARGGAGDRGASAAGLVVWRVSTDVALSAANDWVRAVELVTPQVVATDRRVGGCERGGCRGGDASDAFSAPATIALRYTSGAPTYSSGPYSGIALTLDGATITVRFGVAAPTATTVARTVPTRRVAPATPSSSTIAPSTTSTSLVTAATGLWPQVFDTDELNRLLDEMCALELPGCAVWRVSELML
jgi:M6 family metalloprotease-like protein